MKRKVYLYDLNNNLLKEFSTTEECANYFGKEREYINHNLKYCKKIRKDGEWFVIRREKIEK